MLTHATCRLAIITAAGLLAGLALLGLSGSAAAQDLPAAGKTIQPTVPAPGGGGTGDNMALVLAEEMGKRLKATFVIDNKAGANGNLGAASAATPPADG